MNEEVLTRALDDALVALFNRSQRDCTAFADLPVHEASAVIAAWPQVRTVNDAADELARANGYLHRIRADNAGAGWGRRLTERVLPRVGLTKLMQRGGHLPEALLPELRGLLAGPAVDIERLVVIDAHLRFDGVFDVAGWTLSQPATADLDAMTALPSAAAFAVNPWDDSLRLGGCSVLRRSDPQLEPKSLELRLPGYVISALTDQEFTLAAWEPLLLLNLAQPDRVLGAVEYEVEPGRFVDCIRGSGIAVGTVGYADEERGIHEEWDVPEFGPCSLNEHETARMLRFTSMMTPHLLAWQVPKGSSEAAVRPYARLSRSATRFLAMSDRFGRGNDIVRPQDRAEVIFWVISALENLIVPDDDHAKLSRKLRQRAAVLLADDDDEKRLRIASMLSTAYTVRSKVAHGDEVKVAQLDKVVLNLRTYLREVFTRLIILGKDFEVDRICDEALQSPALRRAKIQEPVLSAMKEAPAIA